jgi:DNA-3-methyladenine glycosylase
LPSSSPDRLHVGEPLRREFYERSTPRVARDLLGCILLHRARDGITAGRIVEVEAYCGPRDRGAHSFGGRRTARNEVMYGAPGHAYVYFTYGMHFCLNAVTRPEGVPQAVLLRALSPLRGVELMRERRGLGPAIPEAQLARGPGNLCRAMGIDRAHNGLDLTRSRLVIFQGDPVPARAIVRTPRVGIDYAAEWAGKPWRFLIRGDAAVSGRTTRTAGGQGPNR